MSLVAEVILPLAVKSNFTYRIPSQWEQEAMPGKRVLVVFGKSKLYTGVIKSLREENDKDILAKLKSIDELLDTVPVLNAWQFEVMDWVAFYYFCTEGEVLKAALPSGLKPESTLWAESADPNWEDLDLTHAEFQLMEALKVRPAIKASDVALLWEVENPGTRLRNMQARGLIRLVHRIEQSYKPKTETWIELTDEYKGEEKLHAAFDAVQKAPRQEEVLMLVAQEFFRGNGIAKKALNERLNNVAGPIKALVEKGILKEVEVAVDRMASLAWKKVEKEITFTQEQENALATIRASFESHPAKPILLHGITGSGKTHIYLELIADQLRQGRQVLYLLPEIALTQQIIDKVKSVFGDAVGVYHSRFSEAERVETWQKVLAKEYQVVIGVRSAVFLPFDNLGLVVVDEEHDQSFKQDDPAPRYHARDLCVYMAAKINCHVLLGSATPAFETYYNVQEGRYLLVEMKNRAVEAKLPDIVLVDNRQQKKEKLMQGFFTHPLLESVSKVLERKEQAIIFQNRRGFVPVLVCTNCGHVPRCVNCDISLTWHKASKQLRCHYCGFTENEVQKCPSCAHYEMRHQGIGTEKIEEELKQLFPDARIARMDFDTTRSRTGFRKLIHDFEKHEIDVLVGTQMVSKGLDFEKVTLVGVVDADLMLNFADFRAYERAYQLLTQVAGRAGRSQLKGRVLIQSYMPDNPVLQHLQKSYLSFYQLEMKERERLHYPPFTRMIRIELRHKRHEFLEVEANVLREILLPAFGAGLLGPEYPPISRLRGEFRMQMLIKVSRKANAAKVREALHSGIDKYYREAEKKTLRVMVDVDPD